MAKAFSTYLAPKLPDLVVVAGDIGIYSVDRDIQIASTVGILSKIKKACKHTPMFYIFGNWDFPFSRQNTGEATCIDGKVKNFRGFSFVGFGGSNYTPAMSPNEWKEEAAYPTLKSLLSQSKQPTILVSHSPPKSSGVDTAISNPCAGSSSVRRVILESNPILCVCGHIHESPGCVILENTVVINPGALDGYASRSSDHLTAEINIEENLRITTENLLFEDEKRILLCRRNINPIKRLRGENERR